MFFAELPYFRKTVGKVKRTQTGETMKKTELNDIARQAAAVSRGEPR